MTVARTPAAASHRRRGRTATLTLETMSHTTRSVENIISIKNIYINDYLQVPRSTCRPITPQKPPRKSKQSGDDVIDGSRSQSQPALGNQSTSARERSSSAASVPSLSQKNFKVTIREHSNTYSSMMS